MRKRASVGAPAYATLFLFRCSAAIHAVTIPSTNNATADNAKAPNAWHLKLSSTALWLLYKTRHSENIGSHSTAASATALKQKAATLIEKTVDL